MALGAGIFPFHFGIHTTADPRYRHVSSQIWSRLSMVIPFYVDKAIFKWRHPRNLVAARDFMTIIVEKD
jgi:hypothetical protein